MKLKSTKEWWILHHTLREGRMEQILRIRGAKFVLFLQMEKKIQDEGRRTKGGGGSRDHTPNTHTNPVASLDLHSSPSPLRYVKALRTLYTSYNMTRQLSTAKQQESTKKPSTCGIWSPCFLIFLIRNVPFACKPDLKTGWTKGLTRAGWTKGLMRLNMKQYF